MQDNSKIPEGHLGNSILDTIMGNQAQTHLAEFQPVVTVENLLSLLKERDREIIVKRFGLDGLEIETLEAIGKKYTLTRERIRQIEKDSISTLKSKKPKELEKAMQLLFEVVLDHGNIMAEDFLISTLFK